MQLRNLLSRHAKYYYVIQYQREVIIDPGINNLQGTVKVLKQHVNNYNADNILN